jgi:uncharacterized Tic20 family protein
MQDQPPDHKIRSITAMCHSTGLMWLPIAVAIFTLVPFFRSDSSRSVESNLNWFFGALITLPMVGMLLSAILTIIVWQINRQKHSFIEQSGRNGVNFICSCSLYLATAYTLMVGSSLLAASFNSQALLSVSMSLIGLYILLCLGVILAHLVLSILGTVFALQGKIYHYPLSLQLFNQT